MISRIYNYIILLLLFIIYSPSVYSNMDSARDSVVNLINTTNDDLVKLNAYKSIIKNSTNKIDEEGRLYLDEAILLSEEVNNDYFLALYHCYLGEYYIQKGDYSESFEKLQIALNLGEKIKSDTILAHSNIDVAILFFYWKNYAKAEEHILRALTYAESAKITKYYPPIYNLLGAIYGEKKEPKKAKKYMLKYLKYGIETDSPHKMISAYSNLALISNELDQLDSTMFYSHLALDIALKRNDFDGQHTIYNSLLRIYMSVNEYDSAYFFLNKALNLTESSKAPMKVLFTYKYAYWYYKDMGIADSALYYHETYVNIKDSLFSEEQFNKVSELQTNLETKQHQIVIRNLESQNKIKTTFMISGSAIFALILIVSFLTFRSVRLKNNLIVRDRALMEEKSTSMKVKLDYQQREMAYNALYIVNQNKLYDGVIKGLKDIDSKPDDEKQSALKAITVKLQKNKRTLERKGFELKFKKSHEDFYKKLNEIYPNLTKKDLDLCAYLKLNMSTKEISVLTNQSIRALEVARSRLRKKLDIEGHVNLSEFIRSI